MHPTRSTAPTARADDLSTAVVEAIAEHEGVDPLDLERPLYEVIDPDALDSLFPDDGSVASTAAGESSVTFAYEGCEVEVTGDGAVAVREPLTGRHGSAEGN